MVENAPQMQNEPETGGHRDGNVENERSGSRWLIAFLMAACLLIGWQSVRTFCSVESFSRGRS